MVRLVIFVTMASLLLVLGFPLLAPAPVANAEGEGYWKLVDKKTRKGEYDMPNYWKNTVSLAERNATVSTTYMPSTGTPGLIQWNTTWSELPDRLVPGQPLAITLNMKFLPGATAKPSHCYETAGARFRQFSGAPMAPGVVPYVDIVEVNISCTTPGQSSGSKAGQNSIPAFGYGNSKTSGKMELEIQSTMKTTGDWVYTYIYQWVPTAGTTPPPPPTVAPPPPPDPPSDTLSVDPPPAGDPPAGDPPPPTEPAPDEYYIICYSDSGVPIPCPPLPDDVVE